MNYIEMVEKYNFLNAWHKNTWTLSEIEFLSRTFPSLSNVCGHYDHRQPGLTNVILICTKNCVQYMVFCIPLALFVDVFYTTFTVRCLKNALNPISILFYWAILMFLITMIIWVIVKQAWHSITIYKLFCSLRGVSSC